MGDIVYNKTRDQLYTIILSGGIDMNIKFIQALGLELETIQELIEPFEEIKPGEEVIGEISEELRRLYTYWRVTGKAAGAIENEISWGDANPETRARAYELNIKAQVLHAILWVAIQDEIGVWEDKQRLFLRKGFKIIKTPPKPPMFPMFNIFPGGPEDG
jgi:hypothetical protein